jgi:hypothetical protein
MAQQVLQLYHSEYKLQLKIMANIPKAKREEFARKVCDYLAEMDCTNLPKRMLNYYKETKFGEFGITVRRDKSELFIIFCRFSTPERMPQGLYNANYYSGKYNLFQGNRDVDVAVEIVKEHLEKILDYNYVARTNETRA